MTKVFGEAFSKKLRKTSPVWKKGDTSKAFIVVYPWLFPTMLLVQVREGIWRLPFSQGRRFLKLFEKSFTKNFSGYRGFP